MAAEIEPSFAGVHFNLGLVDAMSGDLVSAVAALSKAKELAPEEEEGRADELLASIQEALQQPGNERVRKKNRPGSVAADAEFPKPTARNK